MSSLVVLPKEWTTTMRPLQDQCRPTEYGDIEALFLSDMGATISEIFDDFDPNPIGVASLAQVHVGRHKVSGKEVAVKVWQLCWNWHDLNICYRCNIHTSLSSVTLIWKW